MNLTLLTHYIPTPSENYQLVADLTIPGREYYCAKFGYRHLIHNGSYHDARLYWAVQRLHLIYDYLFAGVNDVDLVWALNPQSLITSHKVPVTQFLDSEHDFFIHEDINGLNAASFIIRKTEWSKRWLEMIINEATKSNDCWHEQRAMINHYKDAEWAGKIKVLAHPAINSYQYARYGRGPETPGNWQKGQLVLSLPGITFTERLSFITSFLSGDNIDY